MRVSKEDYTEAKSPFIERVLATAIGEREGQAEDGRYVIEPDAR